MELIPVGRYRAVSVPFVTDNGTESVQFGTTKTGTDQVLVNFEITQGPEMGHRVPWFGFFTDKTTKRTLQSLRAIGFNGDDLNAIVSQALDYEVDITVEHNTYEGKTTARVGFVGGGGGASLANQMDGKSRARFAAQMKRFLGDVPEVAGKPADRTAAPPVDSEPPF